MRLLDMLRRPAAIRDGAGLGQFIDEQAAFLTQKGIYEYSRARAGHYAKVLLAEPEFLAAVEASRWQAYPLGLAMVAEMVAGTLAPHLGERRTQGLDALIALALAALDRYPVPAVLGAARWQERRRDLERWLDAIRTKPPGPVKDIPEPFAAEYFELMPIHKKLRGRDFPTTRNYLKVTMCNIHDGFVRRMDAQAVAAALLSPSHASGRGDAYLSLR
jgi:hypothetical protein